MVERRNSRRYRSVDYAMPFLIIVSIGIIILLLIKLWGALFSSQPAKAAYLHIVDGSAEMKAWGTDKYFFLDSDVLIMDGDEIVSSGDAKIIVEYFDGTIMRINSGSSVVFELVDDSEDDPEINIELKDGSVWFNRVYKNTKDTEIVVKTKDVNFYGNTAGVFEIENNDDSAVRVFNVFEGEGVLADVLDVDGKKVLETENVGVGQEIVFTKKTLERYRKYQSPSVLSGISDDFKTSGWYTWNISEDETPSKFVKVAAEEGNGFVHVEPKKIEEIEAEETVEEANPEGGEKLDETDSKLSEDAPADKPAEEQPTVTGSLSKPKLTSVAGKTEVDAQGFYKSTSRVTTIAGTVSGASKVVVNGYTLQKFKPGDTTWSYYANADFGLMKEGENTYEVYAEDADGKKSEILSVKVLYEPVKEITPVSPTNPENSSLTTDTNPSPETTNSSINTSTE